MEMLIVRVQKYGVSRLAKTVSHWFQIENEALEVLHVDQYIHRILVEEDWNGYEDAANSLYAASGDASWKLRS